MWKYGAEDGGLARIINTFILKGLALCAAIFD